MQATLAYKVAALGPNDAVVRVLFDGMAIVFAFLGVPFAVAVGAVSVLALSRSFMPRWLGLWGIVAAVLSVAGATSPLFKTGALSTQGSLGFVPFLASMVWILMTSVAMVQHAEAPAARAVPRTV